ncbi:MAG: hypothetical protein M1813_000810 [Trichoglossum hirsutum]|nr:MAG: hypothetical protein M1813_000810 [Trichoglossum hirsutum]
MRTSAPLFPRPVSPVDTRPLSPTPSDVTAPDSESEVNPENRAAKRRRIEQIAQQYLSGQPIFILSAGLRGPFDKNWSNPWGKRGKRADRHVVNETPGCAAASERKRRKKDTEQEKAETTTPDESADNGTAKVSNEKALPGGDWGKVGSNEQPPPEGGPAFGVGNKKAEQPTEPLKGILKQTKATPSTEKWLKQTTMSHEPRNPGPNYKGTSTLTLEGQMPPDPATAVVAALLPQASNRLEATAATSVSTPIKAPAASMHTGFTPINNSNKPMFYPLASGTGLVAEADKADSNEVKAKKRPRYIDFTAMSSPGKPKYTNRPNITSKSKAKRKASRSPAKDSNDERTTGVPPTGQDRCELVPTVTQTGNPTPDAQSTHKRRESLENNISTQAEILNAQRLFQAEITPLGGKPPQPLLPVPVQASPGTKTGDATNPTSTHDVPAFRSLSTPHQGRNPDRNNKGDSPDTDVISTQELIDAVSPFTFSTVKKRPNNGIFTKRTPPTQTPSRHTSFALASEGGTFGRMGLDMETSPEIEDPTIPLQEGDGKRVTTAPREKVTPLPPSATSSNIPAKSSRKSDSNPSNGDSEEEMDNCIDDISSYLEGWDLELELKRVAATKSAGIPTTSNKKGILSGGLC